MMVWKRVVISSCSRVLGTVATLVVAFAMTPFVVRTFGDHWYGLLVIAGGVTNYYYLLDFGLSAAASRYIAVRIAEKNEQGLNEAVSTAMAIFGVLGLCVVGISAAVAIVASRFAAPADVATLRWILMIQGISLGVGFPVKAYGGVIFAHFRHDIVELYGIFKVFADACVIYYLLTHGYGLISYVVAGAISSQLYNVVFYKTAMRLSPGLDASVRHFRLALTRQMFGYSVWTMVDQFSDSLRFRIDSLVIAAYLGASVVTHYSIGARLAEYAVMFVFRATNFMAPLYAGYDARGEVRELQAALITATRVNALLAFCCGGLLIVLGGPFIIHWMGATYADSYLVTVALVIGLMTEAVVTPCGNLLYGMARQKFYSIGSAAEALANVALSIYLVHRIGMVGVAWGTTIPLIVNRLIIVPLYTCHTVRLAPSKFYYTLVPTALVSGGVLAVLYLIVHHVIPITSYPGLAAAAVAPVVPLTVLAFVFLLTTKERAVLASTALARIPRLRAAR